MRRDYKPASYPVIKGGETTFLTGELQRISEAVRALGKAGTLSLRDTDNSHTLTVELGTDLTDDHTLTINVPDADTALTLTGNASLQGTNTGDQTITLTGDVTGSGGGSFAATIGNDKVTNAQLANMATATFKARNTAGTGDPEDITVTQATSMLNLFTSSLKGLVPSPAGATTTFLRADGTWAAVTVPAAASAADEEAVTSTTVFTSPGTQHRHPSAAKAWVKFTGSTGAILASYNVSSVTRHGAGAYTVNFTNAFSSAEFLALCQTTLTAANANAVVQMNFNSASGVGVAPTASTQTLSSFNLAAGVAECVTYYVAVFGDQ